MASPVGPEVDTTPRPLPPRTTLRGQYVVLEPLHQRHVDELWRAAHGADESWAYLPMGPFATRDAMLRHVNDAAADQTRVTWAARPIVTGVASGFSFKATENPRIASAKLFAL